MRTHRRDLLALTLALAVLLCACAEGVVDSVADATASTDPDAATSTDTDETTSVTDATDATTTDASDATDATDATTTDASDATDATDATTTDATDATDATDSTDANDATDTADVPPAPRCGDGVVQTGEQCDDGDIVPDDGCSMTCTVEPGFTCDPDPPHLCITTCGDGVPVGAEACDDGGTTGGDGCSATCTVEPGYACMGAPSACATGCGDRFIAGLEQCDDGNATDHDGCSMTCTVEQGYTCSGAPSACTTRCGDGFTAGAEVCDDGNVQANDYCSPDCRTISGFCADNIKQANEQCGDGNTNNGDYCSSDCQAITGSCGDSTQQANEQCDDGNANNNDACLSTCRAATCGDAILYTGVESCDDANTNNGDGCSVDCALEVPAAGGVSILSGDINVSLPTWSRPYSDCSENTSAGYYYQAMTFVNNTGAEQRLKVNAAWSTGDGYLHWYPAPFDPTDLASCIVGNDDFSGTTQSQLNNLVMQPGERRTLIASTFGMGSVLGPFTLTVTASDGSCGNGILDATEACDDGNTTDGDGCSAACARVFTGALTASDPLWARPSASCTAQGSVNYYYDAHTFTNTSAAPMSVTITAAWTGGDGFLHLFQPPFTASTPTTSCLTGNDDFSGTTQSQIVSQIIPAGESRVIVASTYSTTTAISAYTISVTVP
jgi:cysteine-rich repeat protein